jgi:hypothetical protein
MKEAESLALAPNSAAPADRSSFVGWCSHSWELANPADAIRLDAYDAQAGAGPFYTKCGYRELAHVVYKNNPLIYFERILTP